jgi:2-polyprenyl-3-methyl-5-hydroxy-6-metoxy-1,4-benzoquinol methylase
MSGYYESQYECLDKAIDESGLERFGPMSSFTWRNDPKRLLFVLSRYKFAAKLLSGSKNVLEVGCGDGFASRIVKQCVENLCLSDADPKMIDSASQTCSSLYPVDFLCHNFVEGKLSLDGKKRFDGLYMLDVLEHIPASSEERFLLNILGCLEENAKVVVGLPSLESQQYASPESKLGHVNCKSQEELVGLLSKYFKSVVCFGMNDEVVHTGFGRMVHYNFALCIA